MQNLNTKETMARGVIVLNVSEMPQENISVGKGQNYLLVGDNAIWLKKIPDNSIDSIVTDPPAGISFMGRGWDTDKGGRDHWIAWMQEVATECKRVLKPGGHAFVWAIPRTSHWTATAWENAGFEIRDVVAHIFGSGFPKSLNIGKAVDKLQGNEREETRDRTGAMNNSDNSQAQSFTKGDVGFKTHFTETKGTSEWEGWGTALKPAREDWLLMRKPLAEKTVAENCLKYGIGGINIDESRVEANEELGRNNNARTEGTSYVVQKETMRIDNSNGKRFPANLIHDGSDEVLELFPMTKSKGHFPSNNKNGESIFNTNHLEQEEKWFADYGSAARFFYCAKASKSERNKGCEGLEEKSYTMNSSPKRQVIDGVQQDVDFTTKPLSNKNNHPTVKPVQLMEYLVKLVSREDAVVLDPFT